MSRLPDKQQVVIKLQKDLHISLRELSLYTDITMQDILTDLICERLTDWINTHFDERGCYWDVAIKEGGNVPTDLDQERQQRVVAAVTKVRDERRTARKTAWDVLEESAALQEQIESERKGSEPEPDNL